MSLDCAFTRLKRAAHQLEKSRLTAAVGAHERNAGVAIDTEVETRVKIVLLVQIETSKHT